MAIALDTALAYDEIEALNIGLEAKVKERTTELQQANQDLETANTRLKELDRMKSQFLSHCSHELRTPLTSIKGFTENMLHGMVGPLAERQHLYLTRISANANRLTRMIADLLDLSRIESGTIRLTPQTVPIQTLLEEITQEFLPLTQTKNQELITEITEEDLAIWEIQTAFTKLSPTSFIMLINLRQKMAASWLQPAQTRQIIYSCPSRTAARHTPRSSDPPFPSLLSGTSKA